MAFDIQKKLYKLPGGRGGGGKKTFFAVGVPKGR